MNKSSWRQLQLRSKDNFYSLGTGISGKEAPKKETGGQVDKMTLKWPGSGVRGMAGPLGYLVPAAPSPAPMTRGGSEGHDDDSFPRDRCACAF